MTETFLLSLRAERSSPPAAHRRFRLATADRAVGPIVDTKESGGLGVGGAAAVNGPPWPLSWVPVPAPCSSKRRDGSSDQTGGLRTRHVDAVNHADATQISTDPGGDGFFQRSGYDPHAPRARAEFGGPREDYYKSPSLLLSSDGSSDFVNTERRRSGKENKQERRTGIRLEEEERKREGE